MIDIPPIRCTHIRLIQNRVVQGRGTARGIHISGMEWNQQCGGFRITADAVTPLEGRFGMWKSTLGLFLEAYLKSVSSTFVMLL